MNTPNPMNSVWPAIKAGLSKVIAVKIAAKYVLYVSGKVYVA